jgi:hypothetical protein
MESELPKTFQMRFDLNNEQDQVIARFLLDYPWSRTQKVKEILLAYIAAEQSKTFQTTDRKASSQETK